MCQRWNKEIRERKDISNVDEGYESESHSVVSSSLQPMDYTVHGILRARILEWVASPFSKGIFPIQGSNPGLPHGRQILDQLSHKENPEREELAQLIIFFDLINSPLR